MNKRMHPKSCVLSGRFHLCEKSINNLRFGLMAFPSRAMRASLVRISRRGLPADGKLLRAHHKGVQCERSIGRNGGAINKEILRRGRWDQRLPRVRMPDPQRMCGRSGPGVDSGYFMTPGDRRRVSESAAAWRSVCAAAHAAILHKPVLPRKTHQPQAGFLGDGNSQRRRRGDGDEHGHTDPR